MSEQLADTFKPLTTFLSKNHVVIFIAVCGLGLAFAIYSLYTVMQMTTASSDQTVSTISDFDNETVERIRELQNSSDAQDTMTFPTNRPNPFVE